MSVLRGKRHKLASSFFMQAWFMVEFYDRNQVSFIWFMMLSIPRLRFLPRYSCLSGLKQIKNQTRILWYNFDSADVTWHLNNFREVCFFYLCYLFLFWKCFCFFQRQISSLSVWLVQFWGFYQHWVLMSNKKSSAYYSYFSGFKDFRDGILKCSLF